MSDSEAIGSGATVAQSCSVTVAPSTMQLDAPVMTVRVPFRGPQSHAAVDHAEKH